MTMTGDIFTAESFLPHVGEVFLVMVSESEKVPILLSEVSRLGSDRSRPRPREPFSLVFHAPRDVRLEQQIYRIEREGIAPFDCFLVPIGPDQYGQRFEAVYT